ncbi:MAG: OsmC family protein [Bryobacterales bacterium]|nr:OsmC family protein [Bryobacterales bacterium]
MNVTIRHLDGVRFAAETRGHQVIVDQPRDNKGEDAGMTPPELLLASLGSCAAYYALEYLRTRQLPADGVTVEVEAEKAKAPARLGRFVIRVRVPELDQRHQEGIQRAIRSCIVHNTLHAHPEIELALETPVASA